MKFRSPWARRNAVELAENRLRAERIRRMDAEARAAKMGSIAVNASIKNRDEKIQLGQLATDLRLIALRIDREPRVSTVAFSFQLADEMIVEGYRRDGLLHDAISYHIERAFLMYQSENKHSNRLSVEAYPQV